METKLNPNQLTLIEGEFSAGEAKEILTNIFLTKIRFHELKKHAVKNKEAESHSFSQDRILFLTEELKKIDSIINQAITFDKKLLIKSEITISLCDE